MAEDMINSPAHYRRGGLEAVDVIHGYGMSYLLGSATKYILRCLHKSDGLHAKQDLKKARWFLNSYLTKRPRFPCRPITGRPVHAEIVEAFELTNNLADAMLGILNAAKSYADPDDRSEQTAFIRDAISFVNAELETFPGGQDGDTYIADGKL